LTLGSGGVSVFALQFAKAKEAYRHFERRGHFGKVVIVR
jgi:hypothetical protein